MINEENKFSAIALTCITIVNSLFASLLSLIVICLIINHLYYNQMRKRDKVIVLLSGNIYLCILMYMIILSSMNIQTILGDFYGWNFNSSRCTFVGYMSPAILCVLYYSFVNQVRNTRNPLIEIELIFFRHFFVYVVLYILDIDGFNSIRSMLFYLQFN